MLFYLTICSPCGVLKHLPWMSPNPNLMGIRDWDLMRVSSLHAKRKITRSRHPIETIVEKENKNTLPSLLSQVWSQSRLYNIFKVQPLGHVESGSRAEVTICGMRISDGFKRPGSESLGIFLTFLAFSFLIYWTRLKMSTLQVMRTKEGHIYENKCPVSGCIINVNFH